MVFDLERAYASAVRMRRFEEVVGAATEAGEIHGEMHLGIGQEAVAAALEQFLHDGDAVVSTHRPHLHALAHGVDPVQLLAELLERDGLCRGKGGHMHLFAPDQRFMCTGIVGAGAPIATGYALAQRRERQGGVTVAVAGDGAMNQGGLLESLNLAALWHLPVVFLCEDNGYGISVRRDDASAGRLEARGESFGIPGVACDGTDVEACRAALETAFARARGGEGPSLVVAKVYRFRGHYEGDADMYRSRAEKDEAMSPLRDPVARLRTRMLATGYPEQDLVALEDAAHSQVEGWPSGRARFRFPMLPPSARMSTGARVSATVAHTDRRNGSELVAETLHLEMERDPCVIVLGEDVARLGGVFGATRKLLRDFGPDRVFDTPISETAFMGTATGAAMAGSVPLSS